MGSYRVIHFRNLPSEKLRFLAFVFVLEYAIPINDSSVDMYI